MTNSADSSAPKGKRLCSKQPALSFNFDKKAEDIEGSDVVSATQMVVDVNKDLKAKLEHGKSGIKTVMDALMSPFKDTPDGDLPGPFIQCEARQKYDLFKSSWEAFQLLAKEEQLRQWSAENVKEKFAAFQLCFKRVDKSEADIQHHRARLV